MATKAQIKEMFDNAVHVGHRTQKWDPRMKKFLFGEKDGIHIINLEKSVDLMDSALQFLAKLSGEGKKVLFVSTKPHSLGLVKESAQNCGMPYVINRWIPGLLTNFSTIKTRIKYLTDLEEEEAAGEFDKFTKKEAAQKKKMITKLKASLGGVQFLKKAPDAVFVLDIVRDKIAVKEANTIGIPVIAIVDSNGDPGMVEYPIPGNDDAMKSISYLVGRIADAVKSPKKGDK